VRAADPMPTRQIFIVAFTGMRGAVSLAAALAVPGSVEGRELIVFLCFTTIVWTVFLEGLSLPALLRALDIHSDEAEEREEAHARLHVAKAAMRRIDELAEEEWVREDTATRTRALYEFRARRFAARLGKRWDGDEEDRDHRSMKYQRLVREAIDAQRDALGELRREGRIGDDVLRRVQRDLDLEETRLE
jgi:monovalent cation/hydrogen antiporter